MIERVESKGRLPIPPPKCHVNISNYCMYGYALYSTPHLALVLFSIGPPVVARSSTYISRVEKVVEKVEEIEDDDDTSSVASSFVGLNAKKARLF